MSAINFVHVRAPALEAQVTVDLIAIADAQTGQFDTTTQIGTLGTMREYAVALRALHIVSRRLRDQGSGAVFGGAVSSVSEGQLSQSYKVSDQDVRKFGDLTSTIWGIELIELIKGNFMFPMTRINAEEMTGYSGGDPGNYFGG